MAAQREQDRDYRRILVVGLGVSLAIHGLILALGHFSVPALDGIDVVRSAQESSDPGRWRQKAMEVVQLESPTARATDASSPTSAGSEAAAPSRTLLAGLDAAPRVQLPRSMARPSARSVSRSESAFPVVELEWRRPSHLHSQVTFAAASRAARDAGPRPGAGGGDDDGPDYVFPGGTGGGGGISIGGTGGGGCSAPVIGTIGGVRYFSRGGR